MRNLIHTSIKNIKQSDCEVDNIFSSKPIPLIRDNFLGEYKTSLDKHKVLANLGVVRDLSLEWESIKGDIGRNSALMEELDVRARYISKLDGFQKTLAEGIQNLETIIIEQSEEEINQVEQLKTLINSYNELN